MFPYMVAQHGAPLTSQGSGLDLLQVMMLGYNL